MNKKIKKLSLMVLLIITLIPLNIFADNDIKLWIDGKYVTSDVSPVIENNRTLVPLRIVSENLGYDIDWDEETKDVTVTKLKENYTDVYTVLTFKIGEKNLHEFNMKQIADNEDGEFYEVLTEPISKELDTAPKISNNRTLVPIRAIAENFGRNVTWDSVNKTVVIGDGYKAPTPEKTSTNTFKEASVTRVVDGDTIEVNLQDQKYKVRLIGVDTPETKHPRKAVEYFGKEASAYTTKELTGKTVYLQKDVSETDRYGRLLAYVWTTRPATDNPTNDEIAKYMFNSKLVENGYAHATPYAPDLKYQEFFKTREKIARDNNYGLWGNGGAPVVNTKSVEVKNQAKTNTNTNNLGGKNNTNNYVADTKQGVIKGNRKSKIYHVPGGASYNKISQKNVVYFNSESEAQAAGYRRAKR